MTWPEARRGGSELTVAISAPVVELYAAFYDHDRTTATTYINDKIVVCVLENILTAGQDVLVAPRRAGAVIDGRVAFSLRPWMSSLRQSNG
jgi:hypothetical protein